MRACMRILTSLEESGWASVRNCVGFRNLKKRGTVFDLGFCAREKIRA